MQDRPLARTTRLLVEELDSELLVYDQDADVAHALSDNVARVWQCCDGKASVAEIAGDLDLARAEVGRALDELRVCGLLANVGAEYSRRDAVIKVAKVGAAAAAVPLIYSLAIGPSAAMASPVTCSRAHVQPDRRAH